MGKLILLKTQQDFTNFRASKLYQANVLKIRVHFSANQNTPRFGFIVPKKVLPRVVDRNLIKRRLKSILQKNINRIRPADVVFYPRKEALQLKFTDLSKQVELIFTHARLWKS